MKKTHKLTFIALLVAQALVLYIVENLLPVPFIAPGAKLGLSNIITLICLYLFNLKDTFIVLILRILLSTIFGGSVSSLLYSIIGGIFSLIAMYLIKRLGKEYISIIGVSITGAFFHNLGQIFVSAIIIQNINIIIYLPVLSAAGIGTGFFIGITARYLMLYVKKLPFYSSVSTNKTFKGE
ncbi:Gx transporter family protein [Clostridium sp. SYSU_GA19001]|uniref:Gx transporter family protein n=1 Tax=Clostridium caldaquaticum TaxID=2940653 RepID=UPI0020771851|nr:Gx transporter family protein [Clostridium caldaquaticum]MCM8710344.1 Gx transporter family protein [Clostridium caldaquaticum]